MTATNLLLLRITYCLEMVTVCRRAGCSTDGGLGAPKEADAAVQAHVDAVRGALVDALVGQGTSCSADQQFEAKLYVSQVVAGTNYFVKVRAGGNWLHARIFLGLGGATAELVSINSDVDITTPLNYF